MSAPKSRITKARKTAKSGPFVTSAPFVCGERRSNPTSPASANRKPSSPTRPAIMASPNPISKKGELVSSPPMAEPLLLATDAQA